jgi:protein-L-isoaspartate O-methyltransferase
MAETMTDYAAEREAMVERHLKRRGIAEKPIIDAFLAVPREEFISPDHAHLAYGDHPLPIEAGQTISQPYIVALMIQAAEIEPRDTVLEVGAGSG